MGLPGYGMAQNDTILDEAGFWNVRNLVVLRYDQLAQLVEDAERGC